MQNDTLEEFVILKCLYDEFYNDKFSRAAMITILDSLRTQTNIPEHKKIADNIHNKVTRLLRGYAPPEFELYDLDSNLVTIDKFKGEYVYLGFCTSVSYACIQEFEMLRSFYKRHSQHLKIVIICADSNYGQMKKFVRKREYPWIFLHYGNNTKILNEFDIRAFPTYFFIDKEGKLLLSPAPGPSENLELTLFKILKSRGDI
ncbi:MAG: TlpA disulfide reductase family protein [Bacteroidota bacterium]|nr:TlpA disulfide reductase family protein [Bacteroidota bacterium]